MLRLNKLFANVFTRAFVEESMGSKYVEATRLEFDKLYVESSPSSPVFFILSPGVDPLKDVEKLGTRLPFSFFFFSSSQLRRLLILLVFPSSRNEAWLHNRPGHFAQRVPGSGAGGGGREAGEQRLQMWTLGYFTGELLQTALNPPNDIISAPCAGEVDSIWFNRNHNWLDQLRKWRQRGGGARSPAAQWLQVFVWPWNETKLNMQPLKKMYDTQT